MKIQTVLAVVTVAILSGGIASAGPAPDSKRLAQGKDYIADEQWTRAIAELKAAAEDPHEKNRDEALFWLAHSEHQAGDDASALQTIGRLEREFPKSAWVRLAHSVRVEIAQRMHRDDVLWVIAQPPTPAPPPAPPSPVGPPRPVVMAQPARPAIPPPTPQPAPAPPAYVGTPPAPSRIAPTPIATMPPPPAAPEAWWVGSPEPADQVVRIEALASLIDGHSDRVIPLLKEMALDGNNPDEARRAVFVLAHSARPEAHDVVVEIARAGAEPVQLAAIRELGRFQDANVSKALIQVYSAGATPQVRRQVVASLGERADNMTLFRIAKTERDTGVRNAAIMTLGRIETAREPLRTLYVQTPVASREAVINALFTAKDDDELIRIASNEKSPILRRRAREQLRLLATPKAIKYLTDNP